MLLATSDGRRRVLLIGGSSANARMIGKMLNDSTSRRFEVVWLPSLAEGLADLAAYPVHAVLLDTKIPDSSPVDAVRQLVGAASGLAVLVADVENDDEIARAVLGAGACDYLVTHRLDSYWLPHAIERAIQQRRSEEEVFVEAERVAIRLNASGDALLSTDADGRITYLNHAAERMSGWPRVEAIGRPIDEVLHLVHDGPLDAGEAGPLPQPQPLASSDSASGVISSWILIARDGSDSAVERSSAPLHDRKGAVTGESIVLRDITDARANSLRMSHLANHDPLTGLPNRLLLGDRLSRAIALAHRHQRLLAVLFVDIDRFNYINDSLGHPLGDELLRSIGRALSMCVRSSDTVSRNGGDEFVVVLSELAHAEDAAVGARAILRALSRPHTVAGHDIHITASIGISVYPGDGIDADGLLNTADLALYLAKQQGRNRYQFFEPALHDRAVERGAIEAGLRVALERQEFELHYQPKLNLRTGAVVGAEALIRWRSSTRGLVDPAAFVPVAEESGLIVPIGRWVVQEACRQARAWQDAGLRPITVAVNVSPLEFRGQAFLLELTRILQSSGLDPRHLEIELTESALMEHVETTSAALHALKGLGVQLAIDDFGTGWSSLSYLKRFPIDSLKVDRSFVNEITSSVSVAPLVSAVIHMAQSLGLRVVAEGIETREQLAFLQREHCDEGQGYLFSRPLAADQFASLLGGWLDHGIVPAADGSTPPLWA